MQIFIIILSCCILSGCNFKKSNSDDKVKTTEEVARELREQEEQQLLSNKMQIGQFRVRAEPTSRANQYDLIVEWDKPNIRVEASGAISVNQIFKRNSTQSPLIFPIEGGSQFRLNLRAFTMKDSLVFDGSKEVSVPKDYVIASSFRLSENSVIRANRLFINQDVVISTLQYQLNIYVDELISLGGTTIENFSLGDRANSQTPGMTGGTVIIKAKVARGSFYFYPRGQGGGYGLHGGVTADGAGKHPGCAPGSGANGGSGGSILLDIEDDTNFKPMFVSSRSAGGPRGIRGFVISHPGANPGEVRSPPCDRDERDHSVEGAPGNDGSVCFLNPKPNQAGCLTPKH